MTPHLFVFHLSRDVPSIYKSHVQMVGTRWADAREVCSLITIALLAFDDLLEQALAGIADLASKYDSEGVDVYFLNNPRFALDVTVNSCFAPYIFLGFTSLLSLFIGWSRRPAIIRFCYSKW
jgi:hypothetical protein